MKKILLIGAAIMGLNACGGGSEADQMLIQAIDTANHNAAINGNRYVKASIRFRDRAVIVHGDSMQTAACPQGDGWASVDFVDATTGAAFKMQCPTYNGTEFCVDEIPEVPQSDSYKRMNGVCQTDVALPLVTLK